MGPGLARARSGLWHDSPGMRFRWLDCTLDREARTLLRGGAPVRAQSLVVDLLLLLLANRGRVLAEERLMRELWPDVQVSNTSLRRLVKEARRAIGDDGERQEQIETIRGRGIRFAAEVATEDGWDTSFVGRAEIVEALDRRLEEVANGIGGVTLLHGPAGIGKTRTLAELEARADAAGFAVLRGCGRVDAEGDAFHPWLESLRELGVDSLDAPLEPGLRALSPELGVSDVRRFDCFRAVTRALTHAAQARPVLISLDDLQLADRDSIALLRFVAPALRSARVWILASYRSSGGGTAEAKLKELAALGGETSTQMLQLRGLRAGELGTLLGRHLRREVSRELAELLADRTQGNPLFALELARSLASDGVTLPSDATLARGIGPLVARRLGSLSDAAQRLLRAASALGTEFDSRTLQSAESCSAAALARALDEGEAADLLVPVAAKHWRFTHPLFAEALYAELGSEPDEARAQHLRIAEALERVESLDPFALARHFARARPLASAARVLPFASAAAREAARRYAFADAELWFREALELAEEAGAPARERCELLIGLGDVLLATSGVPRSRPEYERAARLAAQAGEWRLLATAALCYAHRPFALGIAPGVVELLSAAREQSPGDESLGARVASRLGSELLLAGPERALESRQLIAEGVTRARALGDPFVLGRVLLDLSAAQFSADDARGWIALNDEIQRCGRQSGDIEIEFRGTYGRVIGWTELGDRGGIEESLAECRRFTGEYPMPYTRSVTLGIEVMLALVDGDLARAAERIEATERELRTLQSFGLEAIVLLQRLMLGLARGDVSRHLPMLRVLQARFPIAGVTAFSALCHAVSGEPETARSALDSLVANLPSLPHDRARLPALVLAAETAWRLRAPEAAAALEPHLSPYAGLAAVVGNAALCLGSVSQALGWLAAARGDTAGALSHFARARQTHESLRSPFWLGRTEAAVAETKAGTAAAE